MPDIDDIAAELVEAFDYLDDWETRYSYIIDLGAKLPDMDASLRDDAHIVQGCVSQVWLDARYDDGLMQFTGSSDSNIVRGLIALLFALYHGQKPEHIIAHNPEQFFSDLGLTKHLSPSRSNGFYSMVQKIKSLSNQHL